MCTQHKFSKCSYQTHEYFNIMCIQRIYSSFTKLSPERSTHLLYYILCIIAYATDTSCDDISMWMWMWMSFGNDMRCHSIYCMHFTELFCFFFAPSRWSIAISYFHICVLRVLCKAINQSTNKVSKQMKWNKMKWNVNGINWPVCSFKSSLISQCANERK